MEKAEAEKQKGEGKLLKGERELVLPGDKIVESMDFLPGKNCFREGNTILAKRLGILSVSNRVISVIPLNSVYIPKPGDMVIGEVVEIQPTGWVVNIDAPQDAYLPLSGVRKFIDTTKMDLSKFYGMGDIIYAKIVSSNQGSIHLTMQDSRARKLIGGRIAKINPAKVPRLIGKQGSMISMIKSKTGCRISVGQNGLIWIDGKKCNEVLMVIKLIEDEAQVEGLTDRISEMLGGEEKTKAGSTGNAASQGTEGHSQEEGVKNEN